MNRLDYVHRPTTEQVAEHPDLTGAGLLLYGDSGKGKTVMAVQILRDIIRSNRMHWIDDSDKSRVLVSMLGTFVDWQDMSRLMREEHSEPSIEWSILDRIMDGEPAMTSGNYRKSKH